MKFSTQFKKLNYPIFTTIRQNKGYYKEGQTIKIETPKETFRAEIVSIRPIKKKDITYDIARLDADCTKLKLLLMLEHWYGTSYDDYILITLFKCNNMRILQ